MFPLLAQIPTATAGQVNTVLIGGSAILAIAALVKSFMRQPPIEVDLQKVKEQVRDELNDDMAILRQELNGRLQGLSEKIESRTSALKQDIGDMVRASTAAGEARVGRLEHRMESGEQSRLADTHAILEKLGELRGEVRAARGNP